MGRAGGGFKVVAARSGRRWGYSGKKTTCPCHASASLDGFQFDQVRLTNVMVNGDDQQSNACSSPNQPPVANDDSASTPEDTPVDITLVAHDPENQSLTYSIVSQPTHGQLGSVSGDDVTYTPNSGYF